LLATDVDCFFPANSSGDVATHKPTPNSKGNPEIRLIDTPRFCLQQLPWFLRQQWPA
jgi:hypothetical protein